MSSRSLRLGSNSSRNGWESTNVVEGVSTADIKVFRTSILARRFPGLKNLTDEDVAALIVADRAATGRKIEAPVKHYPKTVHVKGEKKLRNDPIWVPNNAVEAKDSILMPPEEAFVGMYSPYEADREDFLEKKHSDERKQLQGAFVPSSWSQAKDTVEVNYFINSATADVKMAEKIERMARTNANLIDYRDVYTQRQGKRVV